MKKKSIVVFAAHPDDEVLGCGATISKYRNKYNIYCVFMSDGESARKLPKLILQKKIKAREIAAKKAAKILGIKKVFFAKFPDNGMDKIPILQIIKYIENILQQIKPVKVYTHFSDDLNIDHSITSKAVTTATRPLKKNTVKEILHFEIPSNTEWKFSKKNFFNPNFYEDISKNIKQKLKAIQCYKSEMRKYPHPRSLKGIEVFSKFRGMAAGLKNAEAYIISRKIK